VADSIRERIISAVFANLEGIIRNPAFKRSDKLQSVQRFRHHRKGDKTWVNQRTEETILVRTVSQTINTGQGECGNHLNELVIWVEWVLIGETIDDSDFNEVAHDVEKALWQQGDELDGLHRGMRGEDQILVPGEESETDGVLYTLSITYSTAIGDPTEKGI